MASRPPRAPQPTRSRARARRRRRLCRLARAPRRRAGGHARRPPVRGARRSATASSGSGAKSRGSSGAVLASVGRAGGDRRRAKISKQAPAEVKSRREGRSAVSSSTYGPNRTPSQSSTTGVPPVPVMRTKTSALAAPCMRSCQPPRTSVLSARPLMRMLPSISGARSTQAVRFWMCSAVMGGGRIDDNDALPVVRDGGRRLMTQCESEESETENPVEGMSAGSETNASDRDVRLRLAVGTSGTAGGGAGVGGGVGAGDGVSRALGAAFLKAKRDLGADVTFLVSRSASSAFSCCCVVEACGGRQPGD